MAYAGKLAVNLFGGFRQRDRILASLDTVKECLRSLKCNIPRRIEPRCSLQTCYGIHRRPRFLSLTPAPPPFSAMNSTPALSRADRILLRLSSRSLRASWAVGWILRPLRPVSIPSASTHQQIDDTVAYFRSLSN